jgi:type IV pilus biogenesis protein CpaD/CtpE
MRRHRMWSPLIPIVLILALIVGCASTPEMKAYQAQTVTGLTLDSAAEQMQKVNAIYVQKCDRDKSLTPKQCNDFVAFGQKFKVAYGPAVALWKASRNVTDTAFQKRADEIVNSILTELITFGTTVGYQVYLKS